MSSQKSVVLLPEKGIPRIITINTKTAGNIDEQLGKLLDTPYFEKKTLQLLNDKYYNIRVCGCSKSNILNALGSYIMKDKITGMWIMYDINKNLDYNDLKSIINELKYIPADKYKNYNDYEII